MRTSELPRRRERRNAPYVLLLFVCVTGAAAPRPAICATCGPIGRPELYLGLGHTGEITVVAWSPDGRTLATGARDHRVILWDVATARPRATLLGHTAHIRQIVWRPDGKFLATSDEGDRGFLWEAASGKLRCRLQGLHYQIFDLAWSPDGRSLAGGHGDGEAVVWDGTTGKPRWSLKDVDGQALAWSPDSRTLATGKGWAGIEGTLWDVGTGRRRAELRGDIGYAREIKWSPEGRYLAVAEESRGSVAVWDRVTGRRALVERRADDLYRSAMAWSPHGRLLAVEGAAGSIVVWDAVAGRRKNTLTGHDEQVFDLAWSPDGSTLASSSEHGDTILWKASDWTQRATLAVDGMLRWSPTGEVLAVTGFGTTELLDARSGVRVVSLPTTAYVAWSPDGKLMAEGGALTSTPLRDPRTGRVRAVLRGHAAPVQPGCLAWSPDGTALAAGSGHWMAGGLRPEDLVADGSVVIWDRRSGQAQGAIAGLTEVVTQIEWRPDSTTLATATKRRNFVGHGWRSAPGHVVLWDAQRRVSVGPLPGASFDVAWSPDRKWLATGSRSYPAGVILWDTLSWRPHADGGWGAADGSLTWSSDGKWFATRGLDDLYTLWDAATFTRRTTISPRSRLHLFSWSPDGGTIALSEHDFAIRLYEPASGSLRRTLVLRLPLSKELDAIFVPEPRLAWRPDGHCVAAGSTGNGVIKVWDVRTGRLNQILVLPTRALVALAWSPDGRRLAAAVEERVVYLIDPCAPRKRMVLSGHTDPITALAWSPDGRTLASGSEDGSVRLWSAATGRELAAFYSLDEGKEWLAVTLEGYFTASPRGAEVIQWRQGAKLWPLARFRRRFERIPLPEGVDPAIMGVESRRLRRVTACPGPGWAAGQAKAAPRGRRLLLSWEGLMSVTVQPSPDVPIYRLTVEQYLAMADAGVLADDDRVELLEGWLVEKMTKHPPHASVTRRLRRLLEHAAPAGWLVLSHDPILTDDSAPEPDIAVVRGEEVTFQQRHPMSGEVFLVVEVADTSLRQDQGTKKRIYARASIPFYWIVNLVERRIEVYTDPTGPVEEPDYRQHRDYGPADRIPVVLDGAEVGTLEVRELLP